MENTAKNNAIDTEPKLTEKQLLNLRIQQAIEEYEEDKRLNPNQKWYTAEEVMKMLRVAE